MNSGGAFVDGELKFSTLCSRFKLNANDRHFLGKENKNDKGLLSDYNAFGELITGMDLNGTKFEGFNYECGPITHVKVFMYPDGGISRLRIFGTAV